jgi:CMP/dCMP kinase
MSGMQKEGPIVTLDGPAGSGKSSTARAVAARLHFRHLDSGALYRALTLALLEAEIEPATWVALGEDDLRALDIGLEPTDDGFDVYVNGTLATEELRTDRVTSQVSHLAQLPAVRGRLMDLQRTAGEPGRLVADGRDMGTVVFPDAEVKAFLVADVRERARRRLLEQGVEAPSAEQLQAQIDALEERDRRDSERAHSPLKRPEGAELIDTTGLDFEAQVDAVVALVHRLTTS